MAEYIEDERSDHPVIGICSYAGYVPRFRLNRMTIFSAVGWLNPAIIMNAAGEKAIANYDEDSITMTVAGRAPGEKSQAGIDA